MIKKEIKDMAESKRRVKESNLWHKLLKKVGFEKPKETVTIIKQPYIEENVMIGKVVTEVPQKEDVVVESVLMKNSD